MRTLAATAIVLAAVALLPGCVAAVVPMAAAGAIGKKSMRHRQARAPGAPSAPAPALGSAATAPSIGEGAALAATQSPGLMAAPPPTPPQAVPPGMQFLYGSGEAAALSRQAYAALSAFLLARRSDRDLGNRVYSVVLASGATLARPVYEDCGKKPLAVVLDVDETVLLNSGFEADQVANGNRYDPVRWAAWERTGTAAATTVPGAREAIRTARAARIAVVFNTNRSAANAAGTQAAVEHAGLGPTVRHDTLWLKGDLPGGDGKDARRHAIAQRYCVVAMAGDQLGDFTDLFNAAGLSPGQRRAATLTGPVANLWGQGWFVLPNPVYGTGLRGGAEDVFPAATHWAPPAQEK